MDHIGSTKIFSVIAFSIICKVLSEGPYCGSPSLDPFKDRIVGGVEVAPHEFPWLAKLNQKNSGFVCGATLIADRYLLTAGHCLVHTVSSTPGAANETNGLTVLPFERIPAEDFSVDLGTHEVDESEPFSRQVLNYTLHPQFNFYSLDGVNFAVSDIAILNMDQIYFNYYTLPICLPPTGKILPSNVELVMAGWGNIKGKGNMTEVPMKTSFLKGSSETCKQDPKIGRFVNAADQMNLRQAFCLTSSTTSSCQGDSGGPVIVYTMYGFELVGVISSNFGCGAPGYCTQVSMYIDFIKENTKDGVYLPKSVPTLPKRSPEYYDL